MSTQQQIKREAMEFDVLFVGAGPANLAAAIHLTNLLKAHNEAVEKGQKKGARIEWEDKIAVIEKGPYVGAHNFTGGVLDPVTLKEFMPDFLEKGFPFEQQGTQDWLYHFTETAAVRVPVVPPEFHNKGKYVVTGSKIAGWLGGLAEANGVQIFADFGGTELIIEDNRVNGVITDDKGITHDNPTPAAPGYELRAKVTVLGEGSRGTLTRQLVKRYNLDEGRNVPAFELGVKEVWQIPEGRFPAGTIMHMSGYPSAGDKVGGGWIYSMGPDKISVGWVNYLSTGDPFLDVHHEMQKLKQHPFMQKLLQGGECLYYGGKTLPSGGYYAIPQLYAPGAMIVGDSAELMNTNRLKGLHLAMKSGMLAAEAIFDAMATGDFGEPSLRRYEETFHKSWAAKEMYRVRNFAQAMELGFPFPAVPLIGLQKATGGAGLLGRMYGKADRDHTRSIKSYYGDASAKPEKWKSNKEKLIVDKTSDVYLAGSNHAESQPCHLKVDTEFCATECHEEFGNPCTHFCPANVYEMAEGEGGKVKLTIGFSNCIHCKACDIKCPFDKIVWTVPQGGGGPKYSMI